MKKVSVLLVLSLIILSCSNDSKTIYEKEIASIFNSYKKIDFKWHKAYTTKDSLNEILIERSNAIRKETNKIEIEMIGAKLKKLNELEIRINAVQKESEELQIEEEKLIATQDFDTISQNGILTFKGDDKFYKIMINFDGNGNYTNKGLPLDPIEFDKMIIMLGI